MWLSISASSGDASIDRERGGSKKLTSLSRKGCLCEFNWLSYKDGCHIPFDALDAGNNQT